MAPNKFEKHIKKQLQEREIQPSASAWDALSEKLDEGTAQTKKKVYFWYGIAASIVGVLILSVVYFNTGDLINQDVQIVDTKEKVIRVGAKQKIDIENAPENVAVVENDKKEQAPTLEIQTEICLLYTSPSPRD